MCKGGDHPAYYGRIETHAEIPAPLRHNPRHDLPRNQRLHRGYPKDFMVALPTALQYHTLPRALFTQLCELLRQQAESNDSTLLLLTQANFVEIAEITDEEFTLFISPSFSALAIAVPIQTHSPVSSSEVQFSLTFETEAIRCFLSHLQSHCRNNPGLTQMLEVALATVQGNNAQLQSKFTQQLINSLAQLASKDCLKNEPNLQNALLQQIEQERLINQIATQIRQSLELPIILETATEQVQRFLQVDRLAIYQFSQHPEALVPARLLVERSSGAQDAASPQMVMLPEPIPEIPTLKTMQDNCSHFQKGTCLHPYCQGKTFVLSDRFSSDPAINPPCLDWFLKSLQCRSLIAVPILVQHKLWGLLLAQQDQHPRFWLKNELILVQQIAEHLAIAIHQAQLYSQLQQQAHDLAQQKRTLENRVQERTQALYDALIAAESGSRAKSEFLSAMSHELRTPLTCIIGLSAALQHWPQHRLTGKQAGYIQLIHNSGETLLTLINNILELTSLESGKTVLNIQPISLTRLIQQVIDSLRVEAHTQNITVMTEIAISPDQDQVMADNHRIQQILINLLSNALKFTPSGGTVILRTWLEGHTVIFQVEDTGIGMATEQLPLLFKQFQQLDMSHQRQYSGTGLGLALTKQLVELYNGQIEVESTLGVGSTFTVCLPTHTTPSPDPPKITAVAPHPRSGNPYQGCVVLVEDQEEPAILICDILTAANYQVVWLVDCITAIQQVEILQPDLAIVASHLMANNHQETLQKLLHAASGRQPLKILVLTDPEHRDWTVTNLVGVSACISVPIQPETLLERVLSLTQD